MIQVYTGNGKGKTTAAIGLALRASGAGLNVYIAQFVKGGCYNEIKALKKISRIKVEQFGRRCFIKKDPEPIDVEMAKRGLKKVIEALARKDYQMIIMDEINVALRLKLIKLVELARLIKSVPRNLELVLTGRHAHPEIIKLADLVSEIKEKKHYYAKGVKARRGIEF